MPDRLEVVDAADGDAALHGRLVEARSREVPARRPARQVDPAGVAAQTRDATGKPANCSAYFGANAIQRLLRRQRVTDERDTDAVSQRSLGEKPERFLGPH